MSTMLPKRLVLLFSFLVVLMITQLFLISLKSTRKVYQEPLFRPNHVNFTERTITITQNTHFPQNRIPARSTSIKVLSTKSTTHLSTASKVLASFTSSHAVKNQATADPTTKELATFTSKQQTVGAISQNKHFLENQVPVKRTSITVLSTKSTTHLSTTSKVRTLFTSSHAVENQATADFTTKELATFTSKQQTERTISQNKHFLENQLPVKRTSIKVLSTKSTTHLSTTSKVLAPFTSSNAVKNQATADPTTKELATFTSKQQTERMKSQNQATVDSIAEEPTKFTSEQQTERLNDQVTKNRFHPDSNMLFSNEFDKAGEVKKVDVLLIILTYHKYFHRRKNIRKTWLATCSRNEKIACWFFTDSLETITDPKVRKSILKEQKKHKDIIFTPVGNGIKFGLRFLHLLMWGKANYDFKYIIRADDDIMVCIDHLMWDLPHFPLTNFHYGWMHCQMPNVVYIDEGFSMYSNDLVERYLSQKGDRILCHPFGDQQVAVWEHSLGIKGPDVYRPDNDRIHHHPPASYDNVMKSASNICDNFIAIHGVYKNDAIDFWKRRGEGHFNKYPAKEPLNFCPHYPNVDINIFGGIYHHTPKLCSSNPRWTIEHHNKYTGRER